MEHYALSGYAVPYLVVGVLTFLIGYTVVIREKMSRLSCYFFILTSSTVVWLFAYAGLALSADADSAFFWARVHTTVLTGVPTLLLVFTLASVQRLRYFFKAVLFTAFIGAGFTVTLWATDLFVKRVQFYKWGYFPVYEPFALLFLGYFFCVLAGCLALLLHRKKNSDSPATKRRINNFLLAFGISYIASVDYAPMFGIEIYPFGYVPFMIGMVFIAAGIVKYRLEDITPSFAGEQVIKMLGDPLVVIDCENRICISNHTADDLFNKGESLVGKKAWSVDIKFFNKANLKRLMGGARIQHHEVEILCGNTERIFELTTSILREKKESGIALVCIAKDITLRRKNEAALVEREKNYRILAENVTDVIWIIDRDFGLTYISPSVKHLTGRDAEELLKCSLDKVFSDASHHTVFSKLGQIFAGTAPEETLKELKTLELWFRTTKGNPVPTEARITLLKDEKGRINRVLGVSRDITERRDAEKSLQESEKLYNELINQFDEPIITVDRRGYIVSLNQAAEITLGKTSDILKAKHLRETGFIAEASGGRLMQEFTNVLLGKASREFPLQIICGDGQINQASASSRILRHNRENIRVELLLRMNRESADGHAA